MMNSSGNAVGIRLALLASCNMDLLLAPLKANLAAKGLACECWNAGFDQYRQAILDTDSHLYGFDPAFVLLWIEAADLFADYLAHPFERSEAVQQVAEQGIRALRELVERLSSRLAASTLLVNTLNAEGIDSFWGLEYNSPYSFRHVVATYNLQLAALAKEFPALLVFDAETLAAEVGLRNWYDRRLWYLGRIRHGAKAIDVIARQLSNFVAARLGNLRKCIVIDLDDTLWGGVVGEVGPAGIRLGFEGIGLAYLEFQRELLALRRKGFLLAICSKNNPEDALEVIRDNPAMCLRESDFAAMQINWNDKAENLHRIAEQLNLGLDSFVFIDDNPVERARLRQALPQVLVPDWPQDPTQFRSALLELASECFLKFHMTGEDRERARMYHQEAERQKEATAAANIEDFYRSLGMKITIGVADGGTLPRIAQLTQKTNQFNLTTRRYAEPEIETLLSDPGYRVYWLSLQDKFGPSGIVGVLILRESRPHAWLIDTFLMSCRVMGRTVEAAFLGTVSDLLRIREDARELIGEYIPTQKNSPVENLYSRLGFSLLASASQGTLWSLNLESRRIEIPEWFEITDETRTTIPC